MQRTSCAYKRVYATLPSHATILSLSVHDYYTSEDAVRTENRAVLTLGSLAASGAATAPSAYSGPCYCGQDAQKVGEREYDALSKLHAEEGQSG